MLPQKKQDTGLDVWSQNLRVSYEDLGREIQTNGTYAWTMGGIFFVAGIGILAAILTRDKNAAPDPVQVLLGGFALVLIWSWLLLLFRLGSINAERYVLRSFIEHELNIPRYSPSVPGVSRYYLAVPAILVHLAWFAYGFSLLVSAPCVQTAYQLAVLAGLTVILLQLGVDSLYRKDWNGLRRIWEASMN